MCKAGKRGRTRGDVRRGAARYVRSIRHKEKGIRQKAKGKEETCAEAPQKICKKHKA
jgi:hypothetical protein